MKNESSIFQREYDAVAPVDGTKVYFDAAGKHALLDREQEVEFAKDIEAGLYANHLLESGDERYDISELTELRTLGKLAMTRMIESNTRLVVSIARTYLGRNYQTLTFDDLIQNGNLGLINAIQKFDYAKGFKVSTYASNWIHQRIIKEISNEDRAVRLPTNVHNLVSHMLEAQQKFDEEFHRTPTAHEILGSMDEKYAKSLSAETIESALQTFTVESINEVCSNEEGASEGVELISDEYDDFADVDWRLFEQQVMHLRNAILSDQQRAVLDARNAGEAQKSIGSRLGLGNKTIQRLEQEARDKLKDPAYGLVQLLDDALIS